MNSFYAGKWLVQPQLNRMESAGKTVHLEPKVMQVLLCLVKRPGRLVRRSTLLETVWAGRIVGDEVLSRSVSELRKAFEDEAYSPRFVETIPKAGYRFIAPLSFEVGRPDEPSETVPATSEAPSRAPFLTGRRRWVAGLIGLVLALVAGVVLVRTASNQPFVASLGSSSRTIPGTTFPGVELDPALSPDGTQLAFVWSGGSQGDLNVYVKLVGSETPLQLTNTRLYEHSPSWSPDGSQIAFARSLAGLFVISPLGGPERKLVDIGPGSSPDLAWSPKHNQLVYSDRESDESGYNLYLFSLDTNERQRLTTTSSRFEHDRSPAFSPDGTQVAFTRGHPWQRDLYVVPISGGEPARLTKDNMDIDGVAWPRNDEGPIFSSNRGGTYGLWQVSLDRDPVLVSAGIGNLRDPSVDRQGARLAFKQSFVDTNVWRIPVDGPEPSVLLASTQWDSNPQVSPDGTRVAFASSRSGSPEIWVASRDGTDLLRLTSFEGPHTSTPRWSPDGRHLVFTSLVEGASDLYVVSAEGDLRRRLTVSPAMDVAPSWSNDQGSIYFSSNRSGSWQVWRLPVSGGDAVQVTSRGGYVAFEAPDSESIYYTRRDEPGIWQMNLAGDSEGKVVENLATVHAGNWAVGAAGLYFVRRQEDGATIELYDFETQKTRRVATPIKEPVWGGHGLSVAPDGEVLYSQVDHSHHDIVVIDRLPKSDPPGSR